MHPSLDALRIHFAELDVIGRYLTEVNVTSPKESNRIGGVRLESQVIEFVEGKCLGLAR